MKTFLCSLLLALPLIMGSSLNAAPPNLHAILKKEQDRANTIRVRVMHEVPQLQLDIRGSYLLMNPEDKSVEPRIHGKCGILKPLSTGLKWGEEFPDLYQVKIIPTQVSTQFRINDRPFVGNLTFYDIDTRHNMISVVNDLHIEDYIADLLMHALTGEEPQEAINALAIAARSTAYYQVQHPCNQRFWDVDGTIVGYPGPAGSTPSPAAVAAVQQALRATRYMMLTAPTGSLNDAFYAPWSMEEAKASTESGDKKTALLTHKAAIDGATKGMHAAQILHATFPTAILQRVTPQS